MPTLALSSWSVHRALGPIYLDLALTPGERRAETPYGAGDLALLDLPDAARAAGIADLEICHFHFPRTDAAYLAALRGRLAGAGVRLLTLLVDAGDISAADPAVRERDLSGIRGWIDVAATLGARSVRVVAGESEAKPGDAALTYSSEGLTTLAKYARERGVGILTENWRALGMPPENLLAILDATGDAVGLCADFGNYKGAGKYDALAAILPRATTVHAKAEYDAAGAMDTTDICRCLDMARAAAFSGPYVLIFSSPGDERANIARLAATVRPYC